MDGLIELGECVKHLTKAEKFAFDLETTGLDPRTDRIRGIGLATEERQWYFQVSGKNSLPLPTVKDALKTVFIDREKLCIGHNLKFDLQFCKTHEILLNCKIGDTMILAYTLDENRSNTGRLRLKDKGGLIDELFGVELEGWDASDLSGNLFGKPEDVYAKADVEWTMRCWNKLIPFLNHYPAIQKFYWEVSMPITRLISEMELAGMHVDTDYLLDYQKRLRKEAEALEEEFKKATGGSVSIGSPAALSRYLFEDPNGQKLRPGPWMKKGKSGLYSTDEGTLARYAKENPMCQTILDWRGKNKLLSTYVGPFMEKANKDEGRRIYGSLSQTGTVTGRFCVAADTILRTSEGSSRIDSLDLKKYPDLSILTHAGRHKKILKKIYKGKEEMYEIWNSVNGMLRCTANHRLLTPAGWKSLKDIGLGEEVYSNFYPNGSNDQLRSAFLTAFNKVGIEDVWDIEVEEDHSYVAGGFVNHNSSSDPNMQNLPRDENSMRKAFTAPQGKKLLVADYSQLELRLMAHQSQDKAMLEIYRTGGDIHDNTQKALGLIERTISKNCVAEGSEVFTENGYVPIEEIVGDIKEGWGKAPKLKIMSYEGLRPIEKVYFGGVKPCRRIETDYGIVVEQTLDHEMPIVRDGKIEMVKTEDLCIGDLSIIKVGGDVHGDSGKTTIPDVGKNTSYKDVIIPERMTEEWAKFLGYYVSEGSMTINDKNHYRIGVGFGSKEEEISEDFSQLTNLLFKGRVKATIRNDGAHIFILTSKKMCYWLQAERAGNISGNKRIPKCIQSAPWNIKRAFFQSLFEGDGTVKKNPWTVSITSKSETLIRQVQSELMNVGIVGCIHKETRKDYGNFWVWVTYDLSGFKDKVDFISERKKTRIRTPVKSENRSIVFLDGFDNQLRGMGVLLKNKDKNKITECLTHHIRFGKSRITPAVRRILQGDAKFMSDNGLWTSRIRKLECVGDRKVYDLYEPKHKVMLVSPLVTGDCNFGLIYGLYPQGLKDQLWNKAKIDKTLDECAQWRAGFFATYSGVPAYHNHVEAFLNKNGYVKTLTGRRRHLKELMQKDFKQALRMGINYTIQGSAADIMLIAMRNIANKIAEKRLHDIRWNDVLILMQVHDEIVLEIPEELAEESSVLVKYEMENAVKLSVPLEVDPGLANSWEEAKG
jgi:DNA polymerase I-like protein with 3'-5' exonuclease and polymerase domains/intein/homing endonuclease